MRTVTACVTLCLSVVFLNSCSNYGPYTAATKTPYGACCVEYGDGRQPGIAITTRVGTPVIAPDDGTVIQIGTNTKFGGEYVRIAHVERLDSYYTHLSKVTVNVGDRLQRGQLIGLSGSDYTKREYLHFGLCRRGGSCLQFVDSYDPANYWLDKPLSCFDPSARYPDGARNKLTAPLACGAHAEQLAAQAGR